jgi:hypothetical protein
MDQKNKSHLGPLSIRQVLSSSAVSSASHKSIHRPRRHLLHRLVDQAQVVRQARAQGLGADPAQDRVAQGVDQVQVNRTVSLVLVGMVAKKDKIERSLDLTFMT